MRRILIALSALVAAGCVMPSPENAAADRARDDARQAAKRLYSTYRTWSAQDMGHRASEIDGVEVMRVSGTDTRRNVRLVIRTTGTASAGWNEPDTVTVRRCFELRFAPKTEWDQEPRDVRCPAGRPLTFAPWPKDAEIPDERRLMKVLPRVPAGGRADEAKVRNALESLHLDPKITVAIKADGGVVGVSLIAKPYRSYAPDCTFIRVAPGKTSVWVPSRMQRMPGESGCGADQALHP